MPESTQASGALAVVHELLSSTNLLTSEEPIEGGRRFRITLDGPAEEGTIEVHTDLERVALALVFPSPVPQKRRSAMAKLIGYINWGLMEGAFALSLDSGQLCYKAGFGYAGTTLPGPLVRNALLTGMETIELFVDAIVDVANGASQPRAAYERAKRRA
ncbi:MAG: hypothetical protein IT385_14705 [Deltaproteobacteria bacterium]|nr:hypothetical protein [Deltaproteobacteria bacterium]